MKKPFLLASAILSFASASQARAAIVIDPTNDFLPSFTGDHQGDLDVLSFSTSYNNSTAEFILSAALGGIINIGTAGLYVIGVNTGTGVNAPFAGIGAPNVIFNQAVILQKNGTAIVTGASGGPLAASAINIVDNLFTVRVPLALLASTGFSPTQYTFNLWPRSGLGNNNQISDFAPDNAMLSTTASAIPEPAVWGLMVAGFGMAGWAIRKRRTTARVAFA